MLKAKRPRKVGMTPIVVPPFWKPIVVLELLPSWYFR